jgi:predicted SnoaL-like aldol condensation-catalyzing enzyme
MKKILMIFTTLLLSATVYSQIGYVNGSDFGTFFKTCCVYNQTDMLTQHTSKQSIEKHGKSAIINFYNNFEISKQETWKFVVSETNGNLVKQTYTRSLTGAYSKEIIFNLIKEDGVWKMIVPDKL